MTEYPIIFSGPMVRAILEGRKTQTRRVIKPQPPTILLHDHLWEQPGEEQEDGDLRTIPANHWKLWIGCNVGEYGSPPWEGDVDWHGRCPYGVPGDGLWVKENAYISPPDFADFHRSEGTHTDPKGRRRIVAYTATTCADAIQAAKDYGVRQTPSIFMPRWASRILLPEKDIRVERLQDISEADAIAEGFQSREEFFAYWDTLNKKKGFGVDTNPWVWVPEWPPYVDQALVERQRSLR